MAREIRRKPPARAVLGPPPPVPRRWRWQRVGGPDPVGAPRAPGPADAPRTSPPGTPAPNPGELLGGLGEALAAAGTELLGGAQVVLGILMLASGLAIVLAQTGAGGELARRYQRGVVKRARVVAGYAIGGPAGAVAGARS